VAIPLLAVVSGPAGSGTTDLADALAAAIPCPVVRRDEIKEGIVHAVGNYTFAPTDPIAGKTFDTFFGLLHWLVEAGVTHVAEASFQRPRWEAGLQPLLDTARIRVIRCQTDAAVARERIAQRADETPARRAIHGYASLSQPFDSFKEGFDSFEPIGLPVPSIEVDTTDGYEPSLDEIVAFVNR